MGGKSIPNYLQNAFPPEDDASAAAVPFEFSVAALSLTDPVSSSDGTDTPTEAQQEPMHEDQSGVEVPFYIKVRGKGKGKPIMYDPSKSSVAQIYGTSFNPLPPFCFVPPSHILTHQNILFSSNL